MTLYSSRPPFNDDPAPYRYNNNRSIRRGLADMPVATVHYTHDPRPEFDRPQNNPTNPILAEIRAEVDDGFPLNPLRELRWLDGRAYWHVYPEGARDHARRVLTRLARFAEVG